MSNRSFIPFVVGSETVNVSTPMIAFNALFLAKWLGVAVSRGYAIPHDHLVSIDSKVYMLGHSLRLIPLSEL